MYNSPLVLGIGARRPLDLDRDLRAVIFDVGNNTGNMLFAEAAFRHLNGARRAPYKFEQADLEGRDCIVVTAANWLMPYGDWSDLVQRLEATALPIFLIGVGAQAGVDRTIPDVAPATLRLVRLISERSTSIAVRGQFSADVLTHYGCKNVEVTGCPSLLMAGPSGVNLDYHETIEWPKTVLHGTRHLLFAGDAFQRYLYRQAVRHGANVILQSELADMYLSLGMSPDSDEDAQALRERLRLEYDAGIGTVARFLRQHGHVFFTLDEWLGFLRGKHFCIGSRIHGTIAGLLAGVPSLLVAHDSRTTEMAEAMRIPYISESALALNADLDLNSLIDYYALDRFVVHYETYRRNFHAFFRKNGLVWND